MRRHLACLAISLAVAVPAASLTIDNFEEGNFNFADTSTPFGATLGETSGMSSANVAGGVRMQRIDASSTGLATAASVLVTTPVDDSGVLSVAGAPDGSATFEFIYDGIANNTIDSTSGVLNLDLTSFTSIDVTSIATNVVANVQLTLWSSAAVQNSAALALANGVTSFSLGTFSLDLSDIQAIKLSVTGVDLLEAPAISDISAVPEPSAALLVALGLVAIAVLRSSTSR